MHDNADRFLVVAFAAMGLSGLVATIVSQYLQVAPDPIYSNIVSASVAALGVMYRDGRAKQPPMANN
jgi:hypothetical protein